MKFSYKGYTTNIEYNKVNDDYSGRVLFNPSNLVSYQGKTIEQAVSKFKQLVDEYLIKSKIKVGNQL